MNENMPTNVQLDASGNGTVSFATDVVATIAGLAATEVEGVASMYGGTPGGSLADIFTRRAQNSRSLTRGVRVDVEGSNVVIHLTIVVDFGSPVPDVAKGIQENVKKAVETMSGLNVTSVDVHVQGVSFEKENRAAAEIEAQQRLLLQKKQEAEREEVAPVAAAVVTPVVTPEAPAEEKVAEPIAVPPVEEPANEEEDEGEYELELPEVEDEPEEAEACCEPCEECSEEPCEEPCEECCEACEEAEEPAEKENN